MLQISALPNYWTTQVLAEIGGCTGDGLGSGGVGVVISYDSFTFVVMFSVPSCVNPLHPESLSLVCATLGTNVFCQGKGGEYVDRG